MRPRKDKARLLESGFAFQAIGLADVFGGVDGTPAPGRQLVDFAGISQQNTKKNRYQRCYHDGSGPAVATRPAPPLRQEAALRKRPEAALPKSLEAALQKRLEAALRKSLEAALRKRPGAALRKSPPSTRADSPWGRDRKGGVFQNIALSKGNSIAVKYIIWVDEK